MEAKVSKPPFSQKILKQPRWVKVTFLFLPLIAGFLLYYTLVFSQTQVPNLVGKSLKEAKGKVSASKLNLEVVKKFSSRYAHGRVISQKPGAKKVVRRGSKVRITVSRGKRPSSKISTSSKPTGDSKRPAVPTPSLPSVTSPADEGADTGKVVCIDAGHQRRANLEKEPVGPGSSVLKEKVRGGTRGVITGTPEYEITLKIALKLKPLLEDKGIKVVMIRESNDVNIPNSERAKLANQAKANLFVRIHADGSENSSVRGTSTLFPANNQWTGFIYVQSLKAAEIVQKSLVEATGAKNNGLNARGDITGFNWSEVPVVLPEVGFLSNPEDDRLLNSEEYQKKIAAGLARGILEYLSQN